MNDTTDRSSWHKKGHVAIDRNDFPEWAGERLQFHDQMLAMLAGKTKAMEFGLAFFIGHHPEPDALLAKWRAATPDLVDAEMEAVIYETEEYREMFQSTLAFLTEVLEAAAGRDAAGQ